MQIAVPRDRDGNFEQELVKKGQTRIDGMDDKIVGLYAAGLSVRDIRAHLEEVYGLKVSPDLISRVTDAVLDEVREWQSRALDRMYPIVIFDALRVKIRDSRQPHRQKQGRLRGPWASVATAAARCWACGLPRTKGQSSGSR
ncbi:mutator family transposase [Yoonia sediminilitoris]|uniref:Mutator family transposase n=1 Tax=Yoonia sediminilitoris TaxID=1286148 RepID=A0A2T6K5L0_9RHOB|nr:mutator family transposase [Yoonia sediminilitoris]RCW89624.1 mutator family transposase [Yoonia sediminilitoris]